MRLKPPGVTVVKQSLKCPAVTAEPARCDRHLHPSEQLDIRTMTSWANTQDATDYVIERELYPQGCYSAQVTLRTTTKRPRCHGILPI